MHNFRTISYFPNSFLAFLTLSYVIPSECLWKFPGLQKHADSAEKEQQVFLDTMKSLLQPGSPCNVQENESILSNMNTFIKAQNNIDTVKNEFLKFKGKLCRYDLTVCDPDERKCDCNANTAYDKSKNLCRIRIGWPCTEGGASDQCADKTVCKPWEGSFSYDTETFPTASDFFTDTNKSFCRCNDAEDDSQCDKQPDDPMEKSRPDFAPNLQVGFSVFFISLVSVCIELYVLTV